MYLFNSLAGDTDDLVILIPRYFFTITYMGTHTAYNTAYSAHVVFSVVNGQNITVLFNATILYKNKNYAKKTKLAHAVVTLIHFSYYQYITTKEPSDR